MITPRFSCTQTDESVIVSVHCPSIRASEVEIHVDETLFTLHINPYFLRLNFSNRILEDDEYTAKYDAASAYLTVTLTKEVRGQEFQDLDLLAKLLAPRPTKTSIGGPTIEVIGETSAESDLVDGVENLSLKNQEIFKAAENGWQVDQKVPDSTPTLHTSISKQYGFLNSYSGYFTHLAHTENEVNELGIDAETCTLEERRNRRLQHEEKKWDEEHYMADYADDEYIKELISWKHPCTTETSEFTYTEEESMKMLRLPRKEYLVDAIQTHDLYLTLITLLFSYAYDARTTQHDPTSESAWTICTLTPAFSALDPPPYSMNSTDPLEHSSFRPAELADILAPSYRRSLAFPLYRSFALSEQCRADVSEILSRGRRMVIRCLLEMQHILDHHDVYYTYNKIWTDDFCVWLQTCASDDTLQELARCLKTLEMEKSMIGWDLEELEMAAREVQPRESDSDDEPE